jgi:RNA polymerase sigma-70 factor (ECF subfamily)
MSSGRSTSVTLLERVRVREPEAWGRLLRLYGPLVEAWCLRGGVRGADAEDVTQEVFRAVADGLADFRKDRPGDTFRGWLKGVTRHKLLDHYRRGRRAPGARGGSDAQRRLQQVPAPELPDDDPADLTGLYHRALELVRGEFEPRTWQAFLRVVVDGRTAAEAGAELGLTAPAVRMAKSRVLRRLREEVGDLID